MRGTTPDGVRAARTRIDEGRAAAGRTDPHLVTVYLLAATGPGAADRLAGAQRWSYAPEDTGVAGDAQEVADAVVRWAQAGADAVVLQPTDDDPDPEGFVRFVGSQVRALVP